jgi:hypothetical protein
MKINGYQLREGIKRWLLQRDAASQLFKDSLFSFQGEKKDGPERVMADFIAADRNVARLEELQQLYNQAVTCSVLAERLTLALCVKLVGGAGRQEKMWREAAVGKKERYSYREESRERDKDKEYATPALSIKEYSEKSRLAAKYASALRNAIARGNATDIDTEKLSLTAEEYKTLFE